MAELRYNPLTKEWIMVAGHRQARPQLPKDWCPFCVGSGRVPDGGYDVYVYPNDFPALSKTPPVPDDVDTNALFATREAYGRCDVLLYSPDHNGTVSALSDDHVHKLAYMWRDEFKSLSADEKIKYVFIFENRGEPVGVTMPHPHGQAYAYPYVPKKLEQELDSATEYYYEKGTCIYCDLLAAEKSDGRRIIFENRHFTVYVPFFSQFTYSVHVTSNRHVHDISAMTDAEICSLGETVRDVSGMYDSLFDTKFPYMMCMHNAPVNNAEDISHAFHFHIEFLPPMRAEKTQQFAASSETGAGAWCNPNKPEDKAAELVAAYKKFKSKRSF